VLWGAFLGFVLETVTLLGVVFYCARDPSKITSRTQYPPCNKASKSGKEKAEKFQQ
jgi:hypothetical protein